MTTDDGFEPLSAKEFCQLVSERSGQPPGPPNPPKSPDTPSDPPSNASLEERLSVAQSQGLSPNLRRQLAFVGANESVVELQALGVKRHAHDSFERSRASHARGPDEAIALCTEADAWIAHGVYLMPSRLRSGVETRHSQPGRWYDVPKGAGTTDSDVEARLILAIDLDVKRASHTSATDQEMQRSARVALSAWNFLAHHLAETSLAYVHSGNGRQIHIALDALPVNDQTKSACAGVLVGMAHLFNTSEVLVDQKLYDPKRILPACGTIKKKGAAGVADRPHRRTAIVTPDTLTRVTLEQLMELARAIWMELDARGRAALDKVFGVKPAATVVTGMRDNPDSPFARANDVDPHSVVEWLELYNARGELVCPGCGETDGVAVLHHGLKCHHNRCENRGRNGFRTNIDLVAEVRGLTPKEAVIAISDRFDLGIPVFHEPPAPAIQQSESTAPSAAPEQDELDAWAPAIGSHLKTSVVRAERRARGIEQPVPLPWPELEDHFGGGLWPGVHVLCSGTGIGKTAAVLQVCMHAAADHGVPTAYVGLEMDDLQFDLRIVGERSKLKWSDMYTGQANEDMLKQAAAVAIDLADREMQIPLHPVNRNPMGWPASRVHALAVAMRKKYPEPAEENGSGGPGSRPILIVLDYLQIIGPEEDEEGRYKTLDLRERIGRAAYALREVATKYNISILVVASVAREKYGIWPMILNAELQWEFDAHRIVNRRVTFPDILVGLGKESGEIEYGADSVSVLSRVPDTYVDGRGESVVFVTAKGRATGARWTPMHFTGFRYESAPDGGAAVLEALNKTDRKDRKRTQKEQEQQAANQKREAAATAREQQLARDRETCLRIVTRAPGIGIRQLRAEMSAELGTCSRNRTEDAVSYCENVSHTITVDRSNPRKILHYPSIQHE